MVLLELAFLLVGAKARELDKRVGFLLQSLGLAPGILEPAQVIDGERELDGFELLGELLMLTCAIRLALEGLELAVDLAGYVVDALQLAIHVLELASRALLSLLVLEDAGCLLDEQATVLGTGAQHVLQRALGDDRMRVTTETGIVENVEYVHEARGRAVDEILALAAAVHAPRDDDLVEVERERAIGIVEHEVDLGQSDRLTRRRAGEDDVFHRLAAQLLGALLAQHPQDGIRDVRLTRPVGTDDDRHARLEREHSPVGK